MRSLKRINEVVNRLNSGENISADDKRVKWHLKTYDIYANELGIIKGGDRNLTVKERLTVLMKQLTTIKLNFKKIFESTVASTFGMKVYLLIHSTFEVGSNANFDWFSRYMQDFLTPTKGDIELFNELIKHPEELGNINRFYYLPDIYYDVEIRYGLWRWAGDGKILPPIELYEDGWGDGLEVRRVDILEIFRLAGIIDLATGEVIIEEKMEQR